MKTLYKVTYRPSAYDDSPKPDAQVFRTKEHAINFYNRIVNCPAYKSVKLSKEIHLTSSEAGVIIKS